MLDIPSKDRQEAIDTLMQLKKYRPIRYLGKWYMVHIDGVAYFRRTKQSIINIIRKNKFDGDYYHINIGDLKNW